VLRVTKTMFQQPFSAKKCLQRLVLSMIMVLGIMLPAVGFSQQALPRPDHVVVVIEENKGNSQALNYRDANYIRSLAAMGAMLTDYHAVTHPSQPNYLALFSGDTLISDDSCPHTFSIPNLASALTGANLSFATYSESLPAAGFDGCSNGEYRRKHNPMTNWQATASSVTANLPFTGFPSDFNKLPTVSFVIPNMISDMHDGSIKDGDDWLRQNMDPYIRWAMTHNSMFVLTFDEDDHNEGNRILTILIGPMIKPGTYNQTTSHYGLLRTLEEMYALAPMGNSKNAVPFTTLWNEQPALTASQDKTAVQPANGNTGSR
jgi:phosphatidylinositol-3-phosphatase